MSVVMHYDPGDHDDHGLRKRVRVGVMVVTMIITRTMMEDQKESEDGGDSGDLNDGAAVDAGDWSPHAGGRLEKIDKQLIVWKMVLLCEMIM